MVIKGANRDTAWYSMIDKEWPVLDAAFRRWLAPENFARDGDQRESLADLTRPVLVTADPERAGEASVLARVQEDQEDHHDRDDHLDYAEDRFHGGAV